MLAERLESLVLIQAHRDKTPTVDNIHRSLKRSRKDALFYDCYALIKCGLQLHSDVSNTCYRPKYFV